MKVKQINVVGYHNFKIEQKTLTLEIYFTCIFTLPYIKLFTLLYRSNLLLKTCNFQFQ